MNSGGTILVAACALVDADGRVLIAQRPEGKSMAGLWEFPGGKVEDGETPEETVIRELQEELGIAVTRCRPLLEIHHEYSDKSVLLDVWWIDAFEGQAEGREGQPLVWVSAEALSQYRFPAANQGIIAAVRTELGVPA